MIRSISLHVIETCSEENLLDECIRACGNATSLFFTALWLQQSHSLLVQEIQPSRNVDLTCYKTPPMDAFAHKWSPCFCSGQWTQLQDLIYAGVTPPKRTPLVDKMQVLVLWRRDAFHPPQVQHCVADRDTCGRCVVLPGTREDLLDLFFPSRITESSNTIISRTSWTVKTNSSRRFKLWQPVFGFSALLTKTQEDRPFASTKISCLTMLL